MNPEDLFKAVAMILEEEAFRAEEASQTRKLKRDERIAFRAGFFRGLVSSVHRADASIWERAAEERSSPTSSTSS